MKLEQTSRQIYEYQPPATLDQAAPVQNTWYTILNTTHNIQVLVIAVNIEDTNEDLEVQVTVDGETIAGYGVTATHSTSYYAYFLPSAISGIDQLSLANTSANIKHPLLTGKSVKIEVRKTTAAGAGNLTGIVIYEQLKSVG